MATETRGRSLGDGLIQLSSLTTADRYQRRNSWWYGKVGSYAGTKNPENKSLPSYLAQRKKGCGGATQIAVIPHSFNTLGQQQIYGSTVGKHLSIFFWKEQQAACSWDTHLHQSHHQTQGYFPQEQVERPAARVLLLLIGRDVLVAQDPKHTHKIPQKYISTISTVQKSYISYCFLSHQVLEVLVVSHIEVIEEYLWYGTVTCELLQPCS